MISTNLIILDFITGNAIAIGLFLGLLKGVARLTENVHDDKIATLIQSLFRQIPKSTSPATSTPVKR